MHAEERFQDCRLWVDFLVFDLTAVILVGCIFVLFLFLVLEGRGFALLLVVAILFLTLRGFGGHRRCRHRGIRSRLTDFGVGGGRC